MNKIIVKLPPFPTEVDSTIMSVSTQYPEFTDRNLEIYGSLVLLP